ncbi:MAG: glycosyltransferase family 2 protein [Bacteroidota bacterium]
MEKKRHPKVSIITVVFNEAASIGQTIKCVGNLTWPEVEYIVVDGGSTDGTVDVIKSYENLISKWESGPDAGLYDAMNKGMEMASGDYFWFINAGDEPASADVLDKAFEKNDDADIYYGETLLVDADGQEIGLRRLSPPSSLTWKDFRYGMLVSHQSFIAARRVSKKYDLRYRFSADYEWCLYALSHASVVCNTGLVLSKFREGGLTRQNILPGLRERFSIMVKYFGRISTIMAHFKIVPRFFWFWIKHGWF